MNCEKTNLLFKQQLPYKQLDSNSKDDQTKDPKGSSTRSQPRLSIFKNTNYAGF